MLGLLLRWIVGAITLFVIAYFVPGFHIRGWTSALIGRKDGTRAEPPAGRCPGEWLVRSRMLGGDELRLPRRARPC